MQNSTLELFFFTRMLYSCLVDADFLDTESFMDGHSREHNETCMEQLWNKLQSYVSGWFTRMLYSCLVDADFLDTESFMDGHSREHNETCMEQLWNKLQSYVSGWFPPKGN